MILECLKCGHRTEQGTLLISNMCSGCGLQPVDESVEACDDFMDMFDFYFEN